jgi:surfeit locus 1 family protein
MMTMTFMDRQFNPPARASLARRVLPTLATLAAVVLFVMAGNWQHRRMLEKDGLRAQLDRAGAAAPISLPTHVPDWSALRYRPVTLNGVFDAPHQILIDNRVDGDRVGYHVVAPFRLDDGRVVLVNRGFVAAGASRSVLPQVPVPAGARTLRGRIELPQRYLELGHAVPAGPLWQNLDPARFAEATGVAVLPIVIEQDAADDANDGLLRNWPPPDLGSDQHRSYMVQWYLFAATALGLWVFFTFFRRR